MKSPLHTGSLVVLFLFVAPHPLTPARAQEPPTIDEVAIGLSKAENEIVNRQSFLVYFERTRADEVVKSKQSGPRLLAAFKYAYAARSVLTERRFTKPGETNGVNVPREPRTIVYREGQLLFWQQHEKTAIIQPYDGKAGSVFIAPEYIRNLGFDGFKPIARELDCDLKILHDIDGANWHIPYLPETIKQNRPKYTVDKLAVEIDGLPCWRVCWQGMDEFFICPSRGFSVLKRTIHWGPDQPRRIEIVNKQLKELKPGCWLPFVQVTKDYARLRGEAKDLWDQVTAVSEYQVQKIEMDDVADDVFRVSLPIGTVVSDPANKLSFRVTNPQTEPFEDAIALARSNNLKRQGIWMPTILFTLLIGVILVGVYLRRKLKSIIQKDGK